MSPSRSTIRAATEIARRAVLAGGDEVALCGFAAAHRYVGLPKRPPAPEITGPVDLRLRGVVTRRLAPLADDEVWRHQGIRVTSPARTMVDLAGLADLELLTEISHRLGVKHGLGAEDLFAVMGRRGRVNGAAKLRALYTGDARILLSRLEKRFVALLRTHGFPLPHQRQGGLLLRRLPLARPPAHRRAARISLPRLPPRLDA
jgi:hypothetical protein